jgi:tetratricopeptide (TPR) repeat protein
VDPFVLTEKASKAFEKREYVRGLALYKEAVDAADADGDRVLQQRMLQALCVAYDYLDREAEAAPYLERLLELDVELRDGSVQFNHFIMAGRMMRAAGQLATSRRILEVALKCAQAYDRRDPEFALAKAEFGATCSALGLAEEAGRYFDDVMELTRRAEPRFPSVDLELARYMHRKGDLPAAEAAYQLGLAVLHHARKHGERSASVDMAESLLAEGLGVVYFTAGQIGEAGRQFRTVLRLRRRLFGSQHFATARALEAQASIKFVSKEPDKAFSLLRRAIDDRIAAAGGDHPETAKYIGTLGIAFAKHGRHDDAVHELERALAMSERLEGADSIAVARRHINLAGVEKDRGNVAGAERHAVRGVAIFEALCGPDHYSTALAQYQLAGIRLEEGRVEEAEKLMAQALPRIGDDPEADPAALVFALRNHARALEKLGRTDAARMTMERMETIQASRRSTH